VPVVSRTDKTRPYWVKALDYPVVVHRHEDGICQVPPGTDLLAAAKSEQVDVWWVGDTECHIQGETWRPMYRCPLSCTTCSRYRDITSPAKYDRKATRRKLRGRSPGDYQD